MLLIASDASERSPLAVRLRMCSLLRYLATSFAVPISAYDLVNLALVNVIGIAFALRSRADADTALADAERFKTAGSVALSRGNLQVCDGH